jgi:Ribbon-helix-helix domain
MAKKAVSVHLTAAQLERLRQRSAETGAPVAELVRRAVDAALPPPAEPAAP